MVTPSESPAQLIPYCNLFIVCCIFICFQ